MKKRTYIACSTLLATSIFLAPSVLANNEIVELQPVQQEDKEAEPERFIQVSGVIKEITKEPSGNYFATIEDEKEPFGFYFDSETNIFDNAGKEVSLEKGMEVTIYIDSSIPMILIYPPKYSPDVVIVQGEKEGTAQLDKFDKNFLNKKKDLVIHIGEDTEMTNLSGTIIKETDITDKDVLIFYEVVLESYPMQTGPSKILLLEYDTTDSELNAEKARAIAEKDNYEVNGVRMIPLRLVAEQLGYEVKATGNGAIVSKDAVSFTITRGSKMYGYNKAIRQFEVAPALLEYGKTYVPAALLEELIGETE